MRPSSNKIFLSPVDHPITSLIIPPKYERRAKTFLSGIVIARGSKITSVQEGDEVAYAKEMGIEIELEDKKFVIIRPKHILAVK
jgi:co-chaperonin GroES (HSP10)